MSDPAGTQPLLLRVLHGAPTDEELAALVAVVSLRFRRRQSPVSARSAWVGSLRPGATLAGLPSRRGPDVWRASALPG